MPVSRFITLEGGEAAGKSTQLLLLQKYLVTLGHRVITLREPGGTRLGEVIRHLLKDAPEGEGMCPETELLLFLASRAQLVREVIAPALAGNEWILCDRFLDSTTVYQGLGRKLPIEVVAELNRFAVGEYRPGLTLVLDVPPEEARRRLALRTGSSDRPDRMESLPPDFHERVRQGYQILSQAEPARVKLVAAGGTVEETARAIAQEVARAFSL